MRPSVITLDYEVNVRSYRKLNELHQALLLIHKRIEALEARTLDQAIPHDKVTE